MLSICIPAYNYARYLGLAVDSCLQSADDFEVVVVDNHSTDGTPALREKYESDPRVRWYRNDETIPPGPNFNRAISLAQGTHIKMLMADDVLLPGAVAEFQRCIAEKPDAGIHGFLAVILNESGAETRRQRSYTRTGEPLFLDGAAVLKAKLRQIARFKEPTCNLFRRDAWETVGMYGPRYRYLGDLEFNMKVASRFGGCLWSRHVVGLRRHGASDGATQSAQMAVSELRELISGFEIQLGDQLTRGDRIAGQAWLLYRVVEMVAQRSRRRPAEAARLALQNLDVFSRPAAWPVALQMMMRRISTGDIQKQASLR
jgi:glycosyltransferase involved in cell wall biosynthesis